MEGSKGYCISAFKLRNSNGMLSDIVDNVIYCIYLHNNTYQKSTQQCNV